MSQLKDVNHFLPGLSGAKKMLNTLKCLWLIPILMMGTPNLGKSVETLSQNATWNKSISPRFVESDLIVPAGLRLTISPGVEVLFQKGASLIIEGEIVALGSAAEPIVFTSADSTPSPGDWGNIRFVTADTTLSYDEAGKYLKGSRLNYCIIEYGGKPAQGTSSEFLGGAVHCRKSSPYLQNLTIRHNRSLQGGGVYCHEFASPYITNCLILENEAEETGGGMALFFYSNAVIKDNVIQGNRSGEHGGGIYFSFSSPQIIGNVIENNVAGEQGGGIYASNTVTRATSRVRRNVLLSNRAKYKADNIYVTAKIQTVFQENCLFALGGFDVYLGPLEADLDLRGNYFGPLGRGDLESRIYDRYDNPAQKSVICDPVLDAPPPGMSNTPVKVSSLELYGDAAFSSDWTYPLCPEAPIYLEIKAEDRNPYHADWVAVRLRSSESNPQGIVTLAWETGPASGIFRLTGKVGTFNAAKGGVIKAKPGEIIFISLEGVESRELTKRVDVPRSYITSISISEELDSLHVVNHNPVITWSFKDLLRREQSSYQIQLSQHSPFTAPSIWDSFEQIGINSKAILRDAGLTDGSTYGLRLRMNNGLNWSDWAELTLRMNSVPTTLEPISPGVDRVIEQVSPQFIFLASKDAEGDEIFYEIQLSQTVDFSSVLAMEKEMKATGDRVKWVAPLELSDDAEYYFRARARDAYETGPWTAATHFWVNLNPEPPLPFALLEPEQGSQLYHLQPLLTWQESIDPDPHSSVHYRVYISRDANFPTKTTLKTEMDRTSYQVKQPLTNVTAYFWKVEAVDNTDRITPSLQVGQFTIDTTPIPPILTEPLAGEELGPEGRIVWAASHDPDPEDEIVYRIQIATEDFASSVLEESLTDTGLSLLSLQNYSLLEDDKEYLFRIRSEDNHGAESDWSAPSGAFFFNQVNTHPGMVSSPITPDGSIVTEAKPLISWGAAADADRSDPPPTLSYLLQLDQGETFTENAHQIEVTAGSTSVRVPGLTDNAQWFYRICARDDEGAVSEWSIPKSFILNTENDPPQPFALKAPENDAKTYQLSDIELSWEATRDVDPLDSVIYVVHLVKAADKTPAIEAQEVVENSLRIATPLENESEYLWWVEAIDRLGERTVSLQKHLLSINTTPTAPQPVPLDGGILTEEESLRWQGAVDPDPADILTYEIKVSSGEKEKARVLNLTGISADKSQEGMSLADLEDLKAFSDNQSCTFLVRAVDPHGATSPWSQPATFLLDLVNDPPALTQITAPKNGLTRSVRCTVTWKASTDPDPGDTPDKITYRLQWAEGGNFESGEVFEKEALGVLSLPHLEFADNRIWSLRVRAEDPRGGMSDWSDPVRLVVNQAEEPPGNFSLLSPSDGEIGLPIVVEFSWEAAADPDPEDEIHYTLYLARDAFFTQDVKTYPGLTENSLKVEQPLYEGSTYYWKVAAEDRSGLRSWGSNGDTKAFQFLVGEQPELPGDKEGLR